MNATGEIVRDLGALVGASVLAKAIGAVVTKVPPEHIALREHCDRALRTRDTFITRKHKGDLYQVRGPGYYFSVGFRSYSVVPEQTFVDQLESFPVQDGNEQLTVASIAEWGLLSKKADPSRMAAYRFAYLPHSEEARQLGVLGICGAAVRNVMMEDDKPSEAQSQAVYTKVVEQCGQELNDSFGAELRALHIIASAENIVSAIGKKAASGTFGSSEVAAFTEGSEAVTVAAQNGGLHVVHHQTG